MSTAIIDHSRTSIEEFVRSQLVDMGVGAAAITAHATLIDLGLDSLDVVELSQAIKKQLMIPVAPRDFEKVSTIAGVVTVILHKAGIE